MMSVARRTFSSATAVAQGGLACLIEIGVRLVKDDQSGTAEHCPSQADPLSLAAR